jgi:hypothetical protein
MTLNLAPLGRRWRDRRRRRAQRRAVEERLRLYGDSFAAPDDVKRAGLEALLAEFEHGRDREG